VYEHTIIYIEDGKIARQVDVEAWDQERIYTDVAEESGGRDTVYGKRR
jgi:hypothetical protein